MFPYENGFYLVWFKLCFPSFFHEEFISSPDCPITIYYCSGLLRILNTLTCYMQFCFPTDKEWIRVFQKNTTCSEEQSTDQIMLRPSFPHWYMKGQVPEQFPDNDVIAIVSESWKVGHMIDWLAEGCYWSGKITKLLNEDMVEVCI